MAANEGVGSGDERAAARQPSWDRARQDLKRLARRRYLARAAGVSLVVGTVLFAINQLDVVLSGHADARVWIKVALTYLVPFCVVCYGMLAGSRRDP